MQKILLTNVFIFILSSLIWGQQHKRALFLGNSYTAYNNLAGLVDSIARTQGDTLTTSTRTPGGYTLQGHSGDVTSLNRIRQGNWDFVILQEQSQRPSFPDAQVAQDVYPYAKQLNDSIEKHNPCGETVFYMTWGRENGDQSNCAVFPPICTYEGMQHRLRRAYLTMTDSNQAICSPVGAVWKYVRDSFPSIDLYAADGSHPSFAGSYLAACTFYATMFRKSPLGSSYIGSLSANNAQNIQTAVAAVVLDSINNWSIADYDVQANFDTASTTWAVINFDNSSQNASNYRWDFGDGSPLDTSESPTHDYGQGGTYTVQLIANDTCGNSDTTTQIINIAVLTSQENLEQKDIDLRLFPNPAKNHVQIQANEAIEHLRITSLTGQEILAQAIENKNTIVLSGNNFPKGIYLITVRFASGKQIVKRLAFQ